MNEQAKCFATAVAEGSFKARGLESGQEKHGASRIAKCQSCNCDCLKESQLKKKQKYKKCRGWVRCMQSNLQEYFPSSSFCTVQVFHVPQTLVWNTEQNSREFQNLTSRSAGSKLNQFLRKIGKRRNSVVFAPERKLAKSLRTRPAREFGRVAQITIISGILEDFRSPLKTTMYKIVFKG